MGFARCKIIILSMLLVFFLTACATALPKSTVFEDYGFGGAQKTFYKTNNNLMKTDGGFWNDRISSFVIESGTWAFYKHYKNDPAGVIKYAEYTGTPEDPFMCEDVRDWNIENDAISRIVLVRP